ncbi:MAG: NfeD family protein [Planctomycetota bacterium]
MRRMNIGTAIAALLLAALPTLDAGDSSHVVVVSIQGEIEAGNSHLVRRAVEAAQQAGAKLIVFELDTPGGRIDNALEISKAIEDAGIPTVAYVTRWAMSAGALIALSCDSIVMTPGSSIGAAEPIVPGDNQHQEKYVAAIRAEFQARAEKKSYPRLLAMAMVDKEVEVWLVEVDGKEALMLPEEMERARREGKKVKEVQTVNPSGKLLCLTADEAVRYGLAKRITSLRTDLLNQYGLAEATPTEMKITWSEQMVRFLTRPLFTGLLILLGILFLLAELKAPGLSVPGILGLLCFAAVFFGHHLAGLADYAEIILFAVGVLLIGIEIFFMPGSMVVGVPGVIMAFAGLVLSLQGFVVPDKAWEMDRLRDNFFVLACSFGGAMVGFLAVAKYLPKSPLLKRLILSSEIQAEEKSMPQEVDSASLVGKYAVAMTPLHPSGKVDLEGRTLDVVSEGEQVEKGATVQIVKIEGPSIIVAPVGRS